MSQFNPSANVEALLAGYRTGESAVHTGLALAHQRQSNILNAARMEHYNKLDEARSRRQDFLEDEQHKKEQAASEAAAWQAQAFLAARARHETTRAADTARTALNMGQPLGGGMIGGGTVLADEPQPGMGPGVDEGSTPVGTDTVLAPPPAPGLTNGPGAIAEGAPKEAAPTTETDDYMALHDQFAPQIEQAGKTGNLTAMRALMDAYHKENTQLTSRKQKESQEKNRDANTGIRGREADSREATRTARIGQGDRGLDLRERGLDQQADQFSQRIGLERDRFGNAVRHEGVTEAESKRRQDYLEKTYGASGNKLDHDLSSLLNSGSRDQLRAQLRETSITGAPTKVALRLATMMREVGMDPDEERLLGDKDDADKKYNALKNRPSGGWESSPEFENAAKASKALDDYYTKPKPSAKAAPAPKAAEPKTTAAPTAAPAADKVAFAAAHPDWDEVRLAAEWRKLHPGG